MLNDPIVKTVFDLGYNRALVKEDAFYVDQTYTQSSVVNGVNPANINAGNITNDLNFSETDYVGSIRAGDIKWNPATGAIVSGSGVLFYKGGIIGAAAGVVTFQINSTTGDATFTGTVNASAGTIGGFNIGSNYVRDVANTFGLSSAVSAGDDVRFWAGAAFADRATAPFRVYESGRTKVSSLERDDFHWFTLFESVDGFSKTAGGTGSIILGYQYVELTTGTVNGDTTEMVKSWPSAFGAFTWNKDRKLKLGYNFVSGNGNMACSLGIGSFASSTTRHLGFYFSGNNSSTYGLNLNISDGVGQTVVSLGTYNYGDYHILEMKWRAGVSAEFYVDGVLLQTITANLPSGSTSAEQFFHILESTASGAQALRLSFWDFWQAA